MVSAVYFFAAVATALSATAQVDSNGCMRLLGSSACPGFQYAYLSPGNLSNAFPFFGTVTDVASFDAGAFTYFSNQYEFQTTKFINQLGCSNASAAVIRWERTVLCSMWVNEQWSTNCLALYNGTAAATSQKMVCQETCIEYSQSEAQIANSTAYCPGPDLTNGNRSAQLNKDFVQCTNWTTLATNNSATCVLGSTNEASCGFGSSTTQLCGFCNSTSPDSCCYDTRNDISALCGYVLPNITTAVSSTASSASASSTAPTASGSLQNSSASSSGLSGGQLAGTIVGSVIGGLLILGLLVLGILCLGRRKRNKENTNRRSEASFGGFNSASGLVYEKGQHGRSQSTTVGPTSPQTDAVKSFGSFSSNEGPAAPLPNLPAAALAAAAGGARTGNVLPRVKDENFHGAAGEAQWIETGAEVNVLWPYAASLPDELELKPGMKIKVLRLYDDAWGTGQVVSTGGQGDKDVGRTGAFPVVCVSNGSGSANSSHLGSPPSSTLGSH